MTGPDATSRPATAPEPPPARARAPLWMRVTLVLSLAVNLLIVGLVAGAMLARRGAEGAFLPRDAASAVYLRALPHEHREALESGLRREASELRMTRESVRSEVEATLALIRAEEFDPAALAERIAVQRGRQADRTAAGDRLFVERIAAMSVAERRAYADRLESILRRAWRERRD